MLMSQDSDPFLYPSRMDGDSESPAVNFTIREPLEVDEDEIDFLLSKVDQLYTFVVCSLFASIGSLITSVLVFLAP